MPNINLSIYLSLFYLTCFYPHLKLIVSMQDRYRRSSENCWYIWLLLRFIHWLAIHCVAWSDSWSVPIIICIKNYKHYEYYYYSMNKTTNIKCQMQGTRRVMWEKSNLIHNNSRWSERVISGNLIDQSHDRTQSKVSYGWKDLFY